MLERVFELGGRHAGVFGEPEHQPGIDRAGPGRHYQSLERCEAHRGVDRPPPGDGGQGRARAQMAGDDPHGCDRLPAELRRTGRGVGVGEPVEAEPAEVPARAPIEGEGVRGGGVGDGRVKRGVEAAHLWDAGQEPGDQFERTKRGRLMERREVGQRVQLPKRRRVDHGRIDQLAATVHDAVADGIEAAAALELRTERRLVRMPRLERNVSRLLQVVVLVEERELEAARAGVDDQDAHSAAHVLRPRPVLHLGRIDALDPRVRPATQALVREPLAQFRGV